MQPRAGVQRQRLAAPAVERIQRLLLAQAFKGQRRFACDHGQHFERNLGDQRQLPHAARHQTRHVIARHVFHNLAAIGQVFAFADQDANAQHKVAHRAHAGTRCARQARSHHAAYGGCVAKVGGLKSQALAFLGQQVFDFSQRCSCTHSHHQFAGLIADHALVGARVEHFALQRLAVKIFATAAANAHRRFGESGSANALREVVECGLHGCHVSGSPTCGF